MNLFAIAAAGIVATVSAGGTETADRTLSPTLVTMKETRLTTTLPEADRSPFDRSTFELTFAIAVPAGKQLLTVSEPTSFDARDDTGADLGDIKPAWGDQVTYVELVQAWDAPMTEFKLTLAPAARRAASFNVDAEFEATVFAATEQQSVTLTSDWSAIDTKVFGVPVRGRLTRKGDEVSVELQPGTVKDQIETIELVSDAEPVTEQWSMWNADAVTYSFSGAPDDASVRFTVRRGLETRPVRINLHQQPLP